MTTTVSRAVYQGGAWHIDLAPSVAAMFKRVFEGVKKDGKRVVLSDSPRNARLLLWFAEMHRFEFEPRLRLVAQAMLDQEREAAVERILGEEYEPSDAGLALPPRDYQGRAIDLCVANGGLLLGDDPGLGKTVCGIGLSARRNGLPAVVVTLTSLPIQWKREFAKFAPELRTHVLKMAKVYPLNRGPRGEVLPLPDVVIMSYSKLAGRSGKTWAEWLVENRFCRTLVFDEIQELRNDDSDRYRAAKHLREAATWCCGASATPVLNHGGEIYNVISIVQPGALGTKVEFLREWCEDKGGKDDEPEEDRGGENGEEKRTQMRKVRVADPVALGSHLRERGLYLRRTRSDVGRELPPLQRIFHEVEVDEDAFAQEQPLLEELCKTFLAKSSSPTDRRDAGGELDWRMRKMTGVAKAMHVAAFTRLLIESGEKVVLLGWHHDVYDLWKKLFSDDKLGNLKPAFFTGRESPLMKDEQRRRFMEGQTPLLIVSLRAGAGLDGLQKVSRIVVTGEFDWSPGVHEQCLSADTEVLTVDGFRGVDDVDVGTTVCGFDIATGAMVWTPALAKVDRPLAQGEKMYGFRSEKTDIRVTGGHRLVVRRKRRTTKGIGRSEWAFETAERVAGQARRFLPVSGQQEALGVPLRDCDLRLLGWYVTDGSFNGKTLTIYQAVHQPWNEDIVATLKACGVKYHVHQRQNEETGTLMNLYAIPADPHTTKRPRWTEEEDDTLGALLAAENTWTRIGKAMNRPSWSCRARAKRLKKAQKQWIGQRSGRGWTYLADYLDKDISPKLDEMTRVQLLHFIHGLKMGDGLKNPRLKNVVAITGSNVRMLERLQSLCVRRGLSARMSVYKKADYQNHPPRRLWIEDIEEASIPRADKENGFREISTTAGERVWCLTTLPGTLVVRRNGRVAIVGNCEGRIFRDGQKDPVSSYYVWTNWGSDPVVLDVLNLKTEQSEGIRNLTSDVAKLAGTDPDHIKKLAEWYLKRRGKL